MKDEVKKSLNIISLSEMVDDHFFCRKYAAKAAGISYQQLINNINNDGEVLEVQDVGFISIRKNSTFFKKEKL